MTALTATKLPVLQIAVQACTRLPFLLIDGE